MTSIYDAYRLREEPWESISERWAELFAPDGNLLKRIVHGKDTEPCPQREARMCPEGSRWENGFTTRDGRRLVRLKYTFRQGQWREPEDHELRALDIFPDFGGAWARTGYGGFTSLEGILGEAPEVLALDEAFYRWADGYYEGAMDNPASLQEGSRLDGLELSRRLAEFLGAEALVMYFDRVLFWESLEASPGG